MNVGTLKRVGPLAALILLALVRLPDMVGYGQVNQYAVAAVNSCYAGKVATMTSLNGLPASLQMQAAWLKAGAARCRGDAKGEQAAMSDMLAASDARLDLARLANPNDASLAALAASRYPHRADAHFWLAQALTERGDVDGAISEYKKGSALQGPNTDIWMTVGDLYQRKGNLRGAAAAYDQACLQANSDKNGCRRAGQVYLKLGENQLAADRLQKCLNQIGYTWLPVERELVSALYSMGRTKEAVPHLRVLAEHGSADAKEKLKQLGK